MALGSDAFLMPPLHLPERAAGDSDEARRLRYRLYLDFYNGEQWAERRKPGERRLTINYARAFVHKGASYLLGRPVRFELVPNGPGAAAQAEAARCEEVLQALWEDNGVARADFETAIDAAVLGDGAFKVSLQGAAGREDGPAALPKPLMVAGSVATGAIVARPVDVLGLAAGWRGDDQRSLTWVRERYAAGEEEREEFWTENSFRLAVNGRVAAEGPNPYGFIPYVIFPNLARPRQFWGLSDLEDVMSLCSELNVRFSLLSQLLQVSGNPVLVLENVESAEGLRVGPGAVWSLPEGARAELLEMIKEGGVALHVQYLELLYRMLHDLSELPVSGFGREDGSSRSGVALEQLLNPVVQRVQRKRRTWEEALDRRNRMLLALAGLPVHRSRFSWPEILPRDRAALVTQEVGLVAAGIHSLDTARRNLGDEQPDMENDRLLAERAVLGGPATGGKPGGVEMPVRLSGALVEGLSNSAG